MRQKSCDHFNSSKENASQANAFYGISECYFFRVLFWRRGRAMAKKGKVRIITIECTEARKEGKPPSRYATKKNTQTHPERLEKKKYNPHLRRHTVHRELK
jgi:large subunit ribosomal protein L33